jgi:hypothetical protein
VSVHVNIGFSFCHVDVNGDADVSEVSVELGGT